jgi:class 3 adenylate cyclase/pimeloyl-ACP methyl ester carboxylesterase
MSRFPPRLTYTPRVEGQSPPIRFTHAGKLAIAYQVLGQGPDLLFQLGWPSNLALLWEHPSVARFLTRLASFSRLILFDPRGSGLSDRGNIQSGLEQGLDDVSAVLDAASSVRCAHFACHIGGRVALMFAATYPERTSAVVTFGSHPAAMRDEPDYPWGATPDELERVIRTQSDPSEERMRVMFTQMTPSLATDEASGRWWARHYLASRSPREYVAFLRSLQQVDIRRVLGSIRCRVLVMHALGDRWSDIEARRYMAERIPDATLFEVAGGDHLPFFGGAEAILAETQRFLTGAHPLPEEDRVLATILFTDIVGSTERAAAVGDERWKALLDQHDDAARSQVESHRGRLVKTTGDGILAIFDGPARALRCAVSLREQMAGLGIEIRAGLHTGEVEIRGDDVGGIAVHIASRVSSKAVAGEILVSRTVTYLVTGSGMEFADRGGHQLKGVPGDWQLFAAR